MNERAMQFRIGMLVIAAGLILTMLVVWFGEMPALFRDTTYLTVHFLEAPGVAEGIPVRKSGIRIGEVASIRFDDRPNQPDGVLVTISVERKYKLRAGATPRISRALIGDVSIDVLPGTGPGVLQTSDSPAASMRPGRIIEGTVAPDPAIALSAATQAFDRAGGTLQSIDAAAKGLASMTAKTQNLDKTIQSFQDMGEKVATLAGDFDRVVKDNEGSIGPAFANFRELTEKFNTTFDTKAQANLRATLSNAAAGTAKLDKVMTDMGPLAKDLGAPATERATTNTGQAMQRFNRIAFELSLLTRNLATPRGELNPQSTMAKLFGRSELYENLNAMARGAAEVMLLGKPVMKNLGRFADRIANDPSLISRGALQRQ
jgi:phospholipid/cholesterol/gamma-HCH transport system substrate-binding protein